MQTLDQTFIGDLGETLIARPGRNLLQRKPSGPPGQSWPQKVGGRLHSQPMPQRLGLAPKRLQVQRSRQTTQKGREVVNQT